MLFQITPEANTVLTMLGVSCLLIAFVLSLILVQKYLKKRGKSVLYLLTGFLFFIAAGLAALPISFFDDYASDKWTYMVTKILLTFAALYFIKFIVAIFAPDSEKSLLARRLQLWFIIVNITMIVAYHALEVYIFITTGNKFTILWLLVMQELALAIPFIWLAYLALKTARRGSVQKERLAIQFIALSGLALALFFIFNAVNEGIGVPNYWTFPAWACGIVAVICFYLGLERPAFIFNRLGMLENR